MEITVRRIGGFAGVSERLGPVDTASLEPRLAREIEDLVAAVGFFDLPSRFPAGAGADTFVYLATALEPARSHTTSWDDLSERPSELDQLIELLLGAGASWQPAPFPTVPDTSPLFLRWAHSHEEDTDEVEVYRPPGFAFPPSFPRRGFEIRTDGVYLRRGPGPADELVTETGRWTADSITATFEGLGDAETLPIVSYDDERLLLSKQASPPGGVPQAYDRLPRVSSCRLLDFEEVEVLTLESHPPQYVLAVRGTKPYMNMEVDLVPLVYVRQPEYWGIEVVGCLRGIGLPAEAPYTATLRLTGVTGTAGIEVIGASRTTRLDVPPPDQHSTWRCHSWYAGLDPQPPGPPVLRVTGTCDFPTAGYEVSLRRHEPQGINPRDLLLDLVVRPPEGPVPQVITRIEARYEEQTDGFDTVTILPDGVTVGIEEVS